MRSCVESNERNGGKFNIYSKYLTSTQYFFSANLWHLLTKRVRRRRRCLCLSWCRSTCQTGRPRYETYFLVFLHSEAQLMLKESQFLFLIHISKSLAKALALCHSKTLFQTFLTRTLVSIKKKDFFGNYVWILLPFSEVSFHILLELSKSLSLSKVLFYCVLKV